MQEGSSCREGCWCVCFSVFKIQTKTQVHWQIQVHRQLPSWPLGLTPSRAQGHSDDSLSWYKKCSKTNCPTDSEGQLQRRGSKTFRDDVHRNERTACQGLEREQALLDYTAFTLLSNQRQNRLFWYSFSGGSYLGRAVPGPSSNIPSILVSPNPLCTLTLRNPPQPFMGCCFSPMPLFSVLY